MLIWLDGNGHHLIINGHYIASSDLIKFVFNHLSYASSKIVYGYAFKINWPNVISKNVNKMLEQSRITM